MSSGVRKVKEPRLFYIPLELAELLHATLGPLGDVLERENHHWAPIVKKVLSEYIGSRDRLLCQLHGHDILPEISHHTYLASEQVCDLTRSAITEEWMREADDDFSKWTEEVSGETA